MKEFYLCLACILGGMLIGYILCVEQLKKKIDNKEITIRKAKMKNNNDSKQEFTSNITDEIKPKKKRKLFNNKINILKRKKNE